MSLLNEFKLLARYNQLMNQRLYESVNSLSHDVLMSDQGAFFGSIFDTLNHIMVGDILWLQRFAANPASQKTLSYFSTIETPESLDTTLFSNLPTLTEEREKIDEIIIHWINILSETDLNSSLSYKNTKGVSFNKSFASLIHHLFLHQTHHRGQVTTLLSQQGIDFGDTDIIEIITEL